MRILPAPCVSVDATVSVRVCADSSECGIVWHPVGVFLGAFEWFEAWT